MYYVYQILQIEKTGVNNYNVLLQHVTRREKKEGVISAMQIADLKLMSFCESGKTEGHVVVGRYPEHNRMTFFHSGDTQFVFVGDKQFNYIDVIEVMLDPFEGALSVGDLLIISE